MSTLFLDTFNYANGTLTGKGPPDVGTGVWQADSGGHDPFTVLSHVAKAKTDGYEADNQRPTVLPSVYAPWWAEWIFNLNGIETNNKGATLQFQSDDGGYWVALDFDASTGSVSPPPTGPTSVIVDSRTNYDSSDYASYATVDIGTPNATHSYAMAYDGIRTMTTYVDGVVAKRRTIDHMPSGITTLWASVQAGGTLSNAVTISSISAGQGVYMATTFRIYADGTGDFTTIQACMDDPTVQATTGSMVWECSGAVGAFNDSGSFALLCTDLTITAKSGQQAVAGATNSSTTIGTGGTRSQIGTQLVGNCQTLTFSGITILGKVLVMLGGGLGAAFKTLTVTNCRQRITNALVGVTQYGFEIQDGGNADGATETITFSNFIQQSETPQSSATNWSGIRVQNTGFATTVNVYQCSMDETAVKGTGAGILIAHTGSPTTTLDCRNSGIIGTSLSVTKTGGGTLTYAGTCSGNRTTDSNASLGTVSGVTISAWTSAGTSVPGDFNLPTGSALINVAATTPVSLDINGAQRPRAGGIVDGGAVNYSPSSGDSAANLLLLL